MTSGNNTVQVARVDGRAMWQPVTAKAAVDLPESAEVQSGDEIRTDASQSVTLRLADGSTLRLLPNSHFLLQIREADQRPIFRLLEGAVDVDARSNGFIVQAYREAAIKLRMMVYSLAALPTGTSGGFNLWYDENIMKLYVTAGDVDVQTSEQQATLPIGWQAELDPEYSLKLTQVATSTPGPTPTPSDTPTVTLTPLPSATPTATATRTPTRTPTRTLAPTPITTLIQRATPLPTNTEPSEPSGPKPTKPPPQPTEPPPQPTTEPPPQPTTEPPPTEPPPPTERPTPLG